MSEIPTPYLSGVTLSFRDLFAAAALARIATGDGGEYGGTVDASRIAARAYEIADSMLEERRKRPVESPAEPHSPIVARGNEGRRANDF